MRKLQSCVSCRADCNEKYNAIFIMIKNDEMYELVKKKNIGLRILIGIAILFAITQTLKFFLQEPRLSINDELVKTANEINKHAPIVIDSLTTFDNVNALQGNIFQYNYTINVEKFSVDTTELMKTAKESLLKQLKINPNASYFKQNNIKIQANYADKNGMQISKVVILPNEY
jgi:chloramphenicol O-acetyltransferase